MFDTGRRQGGFHGRISILNQRRYGERVATGISVRLPTTDRLESDEAVDRGCSGSGYKDSGGPGTVDKPGAEVWDKTLVV